MNKGSVSLFKGWTHGGVGSTVRYPIGFDSGSSLYPEEM